MERHFERELHTLKENLLKMGSLVERNIANSIKSLIQRDSELAQKTIQSDSQIDELEIKLEEMAIRLLALRQPMAKDLRFIVKGTKIITDLERMGDLAVNICERALELNKEPLLKPYIDLPRMAEKAQFMLKEALDAFVREDTEIALKVCQDDQLIDDLNNQIFRELLTFMLEDPRNISRAIRISFISKYLERIGDHATNIAEDVIYMVKAKDIRHGHTE
ncbi:MAG: phosphate signaling complex protein PhoU [Deltaproteobacteria bacterium]|nr:phosphate signaling complex protein PhoU [Deltaproteobacteria bacterium]MBW2105553.1 phosphate signaling complex protein PhoU [Deltaproteobacteria bacterium]MBW2333048.1 phosphate signaling complex protein PhoU [Deltaproteobacteria bacterium]RLB23300.1 MAG: phosphate transport system regulatory protein PhoU [Deltaproteobacteria bacterium]